MTNSQSVWLWFCLWPCDSQRSGLSLLWPKGTGLLSDKKFLVSIIVFMGRNTGNSCDLRTLSLNPKLGNLKLFFLVSRSSFLIHQMWLWLEAKWLWPLRSESGRDALPLPSFSFPACTRATVPPVICNPHPHKTSERLWSQEELRKLTEVQATG